MSTTESLSHAEAGWQPAESESDFETETVRTASADGGEAVRTSDRPTWEYASQRFELRVGPYELSTWRDLARAHGAKLADMVRAAMEFAAANMPAGYIAQRAEDAAEASANRLRASLRAIREPGESHERAATAAPPAPCPNADFDTLPSIGRIGGMAAQLGPDELAVLETVAQGLARGRAVYGELEVARDRRDFRAEAGDELRDALVYVGAELVRLRRRAGGSA